MERPCILRRNVPLRLPEEHLAFPRNPATKPRFTMPSRVASHEIIPQYLACCHGSRATSQWCASYAERRCLWVPRWRGMASFQEYRIDVLNADQKIRRDDYAFGQVTVPASSASTANAIHSSLEASIEPFSGRVYGFLFWRANFRRLSCDFLIALCLRLGFGVLFRNATHAVKTVHRLSFNPSSFAYDVASMSRDWRYRVRGTGRKYRASNHQSKQRTHRLIPCLRFYHAGPLIQVGTRKCQRSSARSSGTNLSMRP